ncbi:MAG: spore maturation protein [Lachnospiraceae bacterium]|nr:spore maturation protein [Lachnospiraceae bacterium]
MTFFYYISDFIIPLTIFYIIAYGLTEKVHVYDEFVTGAADGIRTVGKILPTLVGLMAAVGMLRASGFLDFVAEYLTGVAKLLHFPVQLIPLSIIRLFSSSAATSLALDLYKSYGTDSYIGLTASIMMGCTETVFYTMSVYFLTAKVTKTRWTLAGALVSTFAGIAASVALAGMM